MPVATKKTKKEREPGGFPLFFCSKLALFKLVLRLQR